MSKLRQGVRYRGTLLKPFQMKAFNNNFLDPCSSKLPRYPEVKVNPGCGGSGQPRGTKLVLGKPQKSYFSMTVPLRPDLHPLILMAVEKKFF